MGSVLSAQLASYYIHAHATHSRLSIAFCPWHRWILYIWTWPNQHFTHFSGASIYYLFRYSFHGWKSVRFPMLLSLSAVCHLQSESPQWHPYHIHRTAQCTNTLSSHPQYYNIIFHPESYKIIVSISSSTISTKLNTLTNTLQLLLYAITIKKCVKK